MDERFPNRMLLAEANQWPEDAAEYFGEGDECHMAFHFPLMPRLFMAIQMEDRFPIIDILQQTPEIPDGCQWALFLRNHDELTLEMVTDEERDYMYRVYAHEREARINLGIRRRLAPLLGNDRTKIELMNGLLLSLPGTPVIYYGDEIGMGDNIYLGDRDGVRTPMQWSGDRNAGFSRANPQRLYLPPIIDPEFHYETVNVETQAKNGGSLLWWMRRMLALRKRYQVFGRGSLEFLHPENRRVLAYVRGDGEQNVLIVANLSRFAQFVELDLSRFKGSEPVELFGQTHFPPIGELPYLLTLGPHAVYWLAIEAPREEAPPRDGEPGVPAIAGVASIEALVDGRGRAELERALAGFLPTRRWFAGKARRIRSVSVTDALPLAGTRSTLPARVVIARVEFNEGEAETYAMPLMLLEGERAERLLADAPRAVVARADRRGETAVIAEALIDPEVCRALLDAVRRRRRLRGSDGGRLSGRPCPALRRGARRRGAARAVDLPRRAEQHLGDLRPVADPQALPARGGRRQPRPRAGALPGRAGRTSPTRPGSRAPSSTSRTAASPPRWRSCTSSSPTRATPGSTPSTPWGASTRRSSPTASAPARRRPPSRRPRACSPAPAARSPRRWTRSSARTSSRPSSWAGGSPSCTPRWPATAATRRWRRSRSRRTTSAPSTSRRAT